MGNTKSAVLLLFDIYVGCLGIDPVIRWESAISSAILSLFDTVKVVGNRTFGLEPRHSSLCHSEAQIWNMVWIKAGFPSNKQHFTRRVRATCTDATVRFVLLELSLAAAFDSFSDLITLTRRVYSHQHHSHFHESASTPVSILCHACLKPRRGFVTVYKPYFKWLFNGLQFFTYTQFIVCLTFIIIILILVIDYQEKLCR